jgi:hypothetical protein
MKVTNNRAKSATVFYKIQGKMKKVKLKPFESLSIAELTDVNAIKNSMTITNFTTAQLLTLTGTTQSATTFTIANPYNDTRSVSKQEWVSSGETSGNTFSRRKISVEKQVKGRFEIKYN